METRGDGDNTISDPATTLSVNKYFRSLSSTTNSLAGKYCQGLSYRDHAQRVVALISFLWKINWSLSMKDPGSHGCIDLMAWPGLSDWSQNQLRSIEKETWVFDKSKDIIKLWLFNSMENSTIILINTMILQLWIFLTVGSIQLKIFNRRLLAWWQ